MKLGFQGWFLTQPYTGIGQCSLGLLRALAQKKTVECTVPVPSIVKVDGIPKKWIKVLPQKKWIPHKALRKWFWEYIQVPAFFAREKIDWEIYPYLCPLPRAAKHLRAMIVHDLILQKDPRYQGSRLKKKYHRLAHESLVYVDQVFTVSEAVRQELGIPAAHVLHNGLPEIPKSLKKLSYADALVYLGGYDIRKNVPQLVRTVAKLKPVPRLILIGDPLHASALYPAVPEFPNVYALGFLTEAELYSVIKSAKAFVHFSDSEGFNIPLLQAMAVGTPAIVKDIPVNREVSHESAHFLPLHASEDSLAKLLSDTLMELEDTAKRKNCIKAQKQAAQHFSWEKSATRLLAALDPHETR